MTSNASAVHGSTPSDQEFAESLAGSPLLSVLPADELDRVQQLLQVQEFQAGEAILEQGRPASGIYLITRGRAIIVDNSADQPVVLKTLSVSDSFGERSVLGRSIVSATVQAAEAVTVLQLGPDEVEQLLERVPDLRARLQQRIDQDAEFTFLRTLHILSGLSRREIQAVMQAVETVELVRGEWLYHEDDVGDASYIIRSGTIELIRESAGGTSLALLEAGSLLGEDTLQLVTARAESALAASDCVLLRLSKQDYDLVLARSSVRDLIEHESAQREQAFESALWLSDTHQGRAALLALLAEPGGVAQYWQRTRTDKRSAEEALQLLARATGLDYLTPSAQLLVDPELVRQVSGQYAQANQVLPIFADRNHVEVLTATPFLGSLPTELSQLLRSPLKLRLSEPQFLSKLIETSIADGEGIGGSLSDLGGVDNWDELDSIEDLKDQAQAAPIIKLVNNFFMEAIARKASDIHVEPYEEELEVRYRVDGILQLFSTAPRRFQAAIISRIKIMANLDISERRIPQDGRISLRLESKSFDIRVATIPTVFGEGVVMRILDKSSVQVLLADIGFEPSMLAQWQESISQPNGVVLVTGPTGSGKTTTLYATLNHVKNIETKIITAEDPVEYQLHGIKQVQIDVKVNLTFAAALRSMLRLDPDIIMVGEIRDFETAEIAVQAALTGHLVFSTLHTNDAPTAITRLVEMGIAPYLVASAITAVLAQRLVRKLCPNCRLQSDDREWHPVGCSQCDNTGYRGRLGIYELMVVDDTIREMIIANKDATVIAAEAQRRGLVTLSQDGETKVQQGLTSLAEIKRVAG